MAQISVNYPVPGDPNSTEDQKVLTALQTIVNAVNSLNDDNIVGNAAIQGSKLANTSIAATKLATNAVEEAKILNGAVTTEKLGNDAVTADKLRDDASTDSNRAVTANHIRNGAVTAGKLGSAAVVESNIDATARWGTVATITDATNWVNQAEFRRFPGRLVVASAGTGGYMAARTNTSGTTVAAASDVLIGTVESGYRPAALQRIPALTLVGSSTWADTRISIGTNGQITLASMPSIPDTNVVVVYYNLSYPVASA